MSLIKVIVFSNHFKKEKNCFINNWLSESTWLPPNTTTGINYTTVNILSQVFKPAYSCSNRCWSLPSLVKEGTPWTVCFSIRHRPTLTFTLDSLSHSEEARMPTENLFHNYTDCVTQGSKILGYGVPFPSPGKCRGLCQETSSQSRISQNHEGSWQLLLNEWVPKGLFVKTQCIFKPHSVSVQHHNCFKYGLRKIEISSITCAIFSLLWSTNVTAKFTG